MNNLQIMRWKHGMIKSFIAKSVISSPIIRPDGASWLSDLLNKLGQTISRCIFKVPKSNSTYSLWPFIFYGNANQSFAFSTTSSFAGLFTADIGLVNFNKSRQTITSGTDHRSTKFMKPLPSSIIAPEIKYSLESKCIGSVLLSSNVPHRPKPKGQGLSGAVKDCSRSNRGLMSTAGTMELGPGSTPIISRSTMRTTKTVGPSESHQVSNTSGFRAKSLFKFYQSFGVIFIHDLIRYILWPLESSAYPSKNNSEFSQIE